MGENLSELKYPYPAELRLYDPFATHPEDIDLKWQLRKLAKDKPQAFTYLPLFSLAVHLGLSQVGLSISFLNHYLLGVNRRSGSDNQLSGEHNHDSHHQP